MTRDDRKSNYNGLRVAILAMALFEAVGIALAVWKTLAKG